MRAVKVHVDNQLVERCLNGDQAAWAELVHRYERLVYSVAYSFCPNRDDGSDIFQQVWLDLYQHLSELRHVEALPAWLITVTRRRAYAFLQARRKSEPLDEETPDVSQRLAVIEKEHGLERALDHLPERCRSLINLLYFRKDEPSYVDIGKEMRMPVSSIGPTRARCLSKLKKLLS